MALMKLPEARPISLPSPSLRDRSVMAMICAAPGLLSTVIESTRCSLVSTRWMARAMRSFSPPAPAPTKNSTLPTGCQAAGTGCACAFAPSGARMAPAKTAARAICMSSSRFRRPASVVTVRWRVLAYQQRIREEPNCRAWLDSSDLFGQFGQAICLGQRGDDAGAVLRVLEGFDGAVGGLPQRHAHIFAPAFALLVGKGGARRHGDQRLGQRAGQAQQQWPYHAHEGDEDRDRISRQADEGGAIAG